MRASAPSRPGAIMNCRFESPLALILALAVPSIALADVPAADGGGGTGGSSSTTYDPGCNIATQARGGTTCAACTTSGLDTNCQGELGNDYSYVCTQSASVQILVHGPSRGTYGDPSGCALGAAPASSGAALAALAPSPCSHVAAARGRSARHRTENDQTTVKGPPENGGTTTPGRLRPRTAPPPSPRTGGPSPRSTPCPKGASTKKRHLPGPPRPPRAPAERGARLRRQERRVSRAARHRRRGRRLVGTPARLLPVPAGRRRSSVAGGGSSASPAFASVRRRASEGGIGAFCRSCSSTYCSISRSSSGSTGRGSIAAPASGACLCASVVEHVGEDLGLALLGLGGDPLRVLGLALEALPLHLDDRVLAHEVGVLALVLGRNPPPLLAEVALADDQRADRHDERRRDERDAAPPGGRAARPVERLGRPRERPALPHEHLAHQQNPAPPVEQLVVVLLGPEAGHPLQVLEQEPPLALGVDPQLEPAPVRAAPRARASAGRRRASPRAPGTARPRAGRAPGRRPGRSPELLVEPRRARPRRAS